MVQALLNKEAPKTQTRRLVNLAKIHCNYGLGTFAKTADEIEAVRVRDEGWQVKCPKYNVWSDFFKCPYGKPGDRLWVRENFCQRIDDGMPVYDAKGNPVYWYEASNPEVVAVDDDGFLRYRKDGSEASPWISKLLMPRIASRITLEIVNVGMERLLAIEQKPRDAWAEGARCTCMNPVPWCRGNISAFRKIWFEINGAEAWNANPWVWVIEFKLLEVKA